MGFSLIEMMIATLILLTGVAGVAGAIGASIVGTQNSHDVTKLVWAVRQKMEEMKSQSFDSIASGSDYVTSNSTPQSSSAGAAYSRTWTVTADSPLQGLKTISVTGTVLHPSGHTAAISMVVRTYRTP